MRQKLPNYYPRNPKHGRSGMHMLSLIVGVIICAFVVLTLILLYDVEWSGFDSEFIPPFVQARKELWDWLQLLGVPFVVALIGWQLQERERQHTEENIREERLQKFFERMSHLILENELNADNSTLDSSIRVLAISLTLDALRNTDIERKRQIILFLYRSGLIRCETPGAESKLALGVTDIPGDTNSTHARKAVLRDAPNLTESNWDDADFHGIDLRGVNLRYSRLFNANLANANLVKADLRGCNLQNATLTNANLGASDLKGCKLDGANVSGAIFVAPTELDFSDFAGGASKS